MLSGIGRGRSYWGLGLLALVGLVVAGDRPGVPPDGLLPKGDIGALRFLEKFPEHDGRGTVVAILDTGVDPGAEGLQTTTDGKPKILDIIDGTGSGDVDVSTVRKPTDGVLEGLTGRKLKLPMVTARDGEFRVGIKRAWDLFPDELVSRMKRVRRDAWNEAQQSALAKAKQDLEAPGGDRTEKQARVDVLKKLATEYDDPGAVYDCVVFHDGTVWRAIVDTDEDGDLTEEKILTDFDRERQFGTFSTEDRLNFGIHVYDDGKVLSIVTDSGSHGTHVAGIVAGHYPDQAARNGVAPGAQIVSVKIGDPRLGGMETGIALLRATAALVRHKCDLANMSFGEPTTRVDKGMIVTALGELAEKHNVLFLSSAMNSGPALSTVGAPGGVTTGIIGVGAYLSPAMMEAQYSHREAIPATAYTFTSRGPTRDGDLGVAIFAPGGAVAPVPQWTLHRSQQMNGTSMASPNACGGLALLVSAAKAKKVAYNATSVRQAIQNTASFIEGIDVFSQGPGLLQVDKAWDYLEKHAGDRAEQLRLAVSIGGKRGVYLRDPAETNRPRTFQVMVEPKFPKKKADHQAELQFELPLALESTQAWVDVGPSLLLASGGRSFEIRVDPTKLEPGAHFAEVIGRDADNPGRGPLVRVPVTVLKPELPPKQGTAAAAGSLTLIPGQIVRKFVAVPPTAQTATLQFKPPAGQTSTGEPARVRVDAALAPEQKRFEVHSVSADVSKNHTESFTVLGGEMLELCFVRDWRSIASWTSSSRESTAFEYELTFHSALPSKSDVALPMEGPAAEVRLTAGIGRETLAPSASLTVRRQLVRPTRNSLKTSTSERDVMPDGKKLNELLLEYEFEQPTAGAVTPHFPLIDNLLYDSDYGSVLWLLFDANKQHVASNDVYPDSVQLAAGKHLLRLQMKHVDADRLEKLRTLQLALDRNVSIPLTISRERPAQPGTGAAFGSPTLEAGDTTTAWINPPASTGGASPGEILIGSVKWLADGPSYEIRTIVPGSAAADDDDKQPALPITALIGSRPSGTAERLAWDLLEFRLKQLQSLNPETQKAEFDKLAAELQMANPDSMAVPYVKLRALDDDPVRREYHLTDIIAAADAVLEKIDRTAIQLNFGANVLPEDEAARKKRAELTQQREILIDVLYRKGRALGYQELPEVVARQPVADPIELDRQFEENVNELRRWVDVNDRKYYLLQIRRERRKERYGLAYQLLLKHKPEGTPNFDVGEKYRDLADASGWKFQADLERRWLLVRFRKAYEPF